MSLKIDFVERVQKGEKIAALCREYRISRTTAHKWVARFRQRGYEGLEDQSRRPATVPLASAEDVVLSVLRARQAYPRWGPRKLLVVLQRDLREQTPSERTIARILKRAELVRQKRRRAVADVPEHAPKVRAEAPNDVWTVDFKGWWRTRNGERCDPLTVRDSFSRFVLTSVICAGKTETVKAVFEKLFRRYGVPKAIQSDNGVPFASVTSRAGLSQLSAWWVSLGIKILRSRPGCPQDNGAHERMHSEMRADLQERPAETREGQQRAMDRWRQQFNHVRPHEALHGKTPAEVYKVAEPRRPVCRRPCYPPAFAVRKVSPNGYMKFRDIDYVVSSALQGYYVGIEWLDPFRARIWFYEVDLGVFELEPSVDESVYLRDVGRSHKPIRTRRIGTVTSSSPEVKPQVTSLPPAPPSATGCNLTATHADC